MKKINKYTWEMVVSFINFILTVPLIFIIDLFGNGCNLRLWLLIIYFIPAMIHAMVCSVISHPFLTTPLGIGLGYVGIQLIINTILFFRLIYLLSKKAYKEKYYLVSLALVLLNYIMSIYFLYTYINATGCNF